MFRQNKKEGVRMFKGVDLKERQREREIGAG